MTPRLMPSISSWVIKSRTEWSRSQRVSIWIKRQKKKIVGIEILNASKKLNVKTILSYELAIDNKLLKKIA